MKEKKKGGFKTFMKYFLVFLLSMGAGVVSKVAIQPSWAKKYSVQWSDEIGTLMSDVSYGTGEANRFDLYLPKDN
ncbi:MAG: alpha/beta hydrolase, partial [Erysipelotrichaceae bacterium]|nr:alpha/beta hydrolase [Erysipelotrichaceae bacterium]